MVEIYKITNLINGKCYVGQTTKGYLNRFHQHCLPRVKTYIGNAIQKHGIDNFTVDLIDTVEDSKANEMETYYIKYFHSHWTENGYNLTYGGDYNPMHDNLVRLHHLNRVRDPAVREKNRQAQLGKVVSESTRQKISERNKEKGSFQTRGLQLCNDKKKQPVYMIDVELDVIICRFESLSEACEYLGIPTRAAGKLNTFVNKRNKDGKRSMAWGYAWARLEI